MLVEMDTPKGYTACKFVHLWTPAEHKNAGYTHYSECVKCRTRRAKQPEGGGYQPIDWDWLYRLYD